MGPGVQIDQSVSTPPSLAARHLGQHLQFDARDVFPGRLDPLFRFDLGPANLLEVGAFQLRKLAGFAAMKAPVLFIEGFPLAQRTEDLAPPAALEDDLIAAG